MNPDEISAMVHKRPFEPFCIYESDGAVYEVRHPDQIIVDRRTCHIGLNDNQYGTYQRVAKVSNIHITRIEPFDPPERQSA